MEVFPSTFPENLDKSLFTPDAYVMENSLQKLLDVAARVHGARPDLIICETSISPSLPLSLSFSLSFFVFLCLFLKPAIYYLNLSINNPSFLMIFCLFASIIPDDCLVPSSLIAADTVVVLDGHILEKPANAEEAVAMLQRLQGREHTVVTGVAMLFVGRYEGEGS